MLKKMLFVLMLALQATAVTGIATAEFPLPLCFPCPEK
jgi:hypothetical protein